MTENDSRSVVERLVLFSLSPWAAAVLGAYILHSAVASFILYHLVCIAGGRLFSSPATDSLVTFAAWKWTILVALCLLICLIVYVDPSLFSWLIVPARVHLGLKAINLPATKSGFEIMGLYFGLVNPVIEEQFWRRTLYVGLRQSGLSFINAATISSILFGSWHWLIVRLFFSSFHAILITMGITIVGFLFAAIYEKSRSLSAVSLAHGLGADIPVMILFCSAMGMFRGTHQI